MPIYEKSVRQLLKEFVSQSKIVKDQVFSSRQVIDWFKSNYPAIKESTITAHLVRMSTNATSRHHYHASPDGEDDLFYKIDGSHFRLYDPGKDPTPLGSNIVPITKTPTGLTQNVKSFYDQFIRDIQNFENVRKEELANYKKQVDTLQDENSRLLLELEKTASDSIWKAIVDPALKDRLSRLENAPYDTVIREAGVVLEDRLRAVASTDIPLFGTALVEAVFSPDKGKLTFSPHRGEQEGVFLLYRGAMQFIRNPPMHKLIDYPKPQVQLFIKLIDSLLLLLTEFQPISQSKEARRAWTKDQFFKELAAKNNSKVVGIVEDLFKWSEENADRVWFGTGKKEGSFTFHYFHMGKAYTIFSIYTNGKFALNYGWLSTQVPTRVMQEFHHRIIEIPVFKQTPEDFTKWPTRLISDIFNTRENIESFKQVVEWVGRQIKKL